VHAAGVHLAPVARAEANAARARLHLTGGTEQSYQLVRAADWDEGIALHHGLKLNTIRDVMAAKIRWIGREIGSGAQECLEELLEQSGKTTPPRHLRRTTGHRGVADAILANWADAGVCLRLACAEANLAFLGVRREAYEICMGESLLDEPRGRALVKALQSAAYRQAVGALPGYDTSRTGELQQISLGRS
jgi:molybdate-binding protein